MRFQERRHPAGRFCEPSSRVTNSFPRFDLLARVIHRTHTSTPAGWKPALRKPVARAERGGVGSERRTARSGCPTLAKAKARGKVKNASETRQGGQTQALRKPALQIHEGAAEAGG